jgi:AcrR family transcriptional regulator
METSTRRRLPPAERRALIVAAAGRLFGERGYDRARLDQIAAAAGVTKPILYRHFPSKRALYLALLERHRDDLASFPRYLPARGPAEQRVRGVLEIWLDYVEAHSYAWQMLFRDSGGGEEIRSFRLEVHARAREVLAAVIAELSGGSVPRRELEPLAEMISMGMAALVLWWLETPGVSRAAVLNAMVRIWAGLLRPA